VRQSSVRPYMKSMNMLPYVFSLQSYHCKLKRILQHGCFNVANVATTLLSESESRLFQSKFGAQPPFHSSRARHRNGSRPQRAYTIASRKGARRASYSERHSSESNAHLLECEPERLKMTTIIRSAIDAILYVGGFGRLHYMQ
jgi:hypothetical protein